jgi:hypothetical protein
MWKREGLRLAGAIAVVLVVLILAGVVVEVVNHVGLVGGLGLNDPVAKGVADASTFALTGVLLFLAWRE